MKKGIILLTLLFVLTLSGCNEKTIISCSEDPTQEKCAESAYDCPQDHYFLEGECILNEDYNADNQVRLLKHVPLIDLSEEYDFNKETIGIYEVQDKEGISYTKLSEFIFIINGTAIERMDTKNEDFGIRVSRNIPANEEHTDFWNYHIYLDIEENRIFYNNFNFDVLDKRDHIEYEEMYHNTSFEYDVETYGKLIELSPLDIHIYKEDGVVYIPLYLADLLFTGNILSVYESPNEVAFFTNTSDINSYINSLPQVEDPYEEVKNAQSGKYMTLLFDNYFGLLPYKGLKGYSTQIRNNHLLDSKTTTEFNQNLFNFFESLNDSHTHMMHTGYADTTEVTSFTHTSEKTLNLLSDQETYSCTYDEEVTLVENDDVYILGVHSFTLETGEKVKEKIALITSEKPVLLDLRCNTGGYMSGVFDLMAQITSEAFFFNYTFPPTGEEVRVSYLRNNDVDVLTNQTYLLTSNATFSAANLFTHLYKTHNLGTVIGEKTGGGACAIRQEVLPNGTIIVFSSNYVLTNSTFVPIERGIEPDVIMEDGYTIQDVLDTITE